MKKLLISIASSFNLHKKKDDANSEDSLIDTVMEATRALADALIDKTVNVTAVKRGSIKFQPSSIMHSDVESIVKDLTYKYAKFPNVVFPTTTLSDNGKDEEYYLTTISDEDTISVVINLTSGVIKLSKD